MDETINWDEIIVYHEIPVFTPDGFYQFKYNKIYIHELVRKYPEYHKYVLEHEKGHYKNNNEDKSFLRKIWTDIKIDWKGSYKIQKNKELYNEIKSYQKERKQKEVDTAIKIHYLITKNLRPLSIVYWTSIITFISLILRFHLTILSII